MRELKFRAFIEGEMAILPLAALQYFDFEGSYVLSFAVDGYDGFWGHEYYDSATKRKCKGAPIMEYTGLKDSKGAEIFECDIVCDSVRSYIVVWDVREAKFILQFIYNEPAEGICQTSKGMPIDALSLRIIGNIYDNPELVNPPADSPAQHTMLHDPNAQQQQASEVAEQTAAVEQEAQEQAMESAEEGGSEG